MSATYPNEGLIFGSTGHLSTVPILAKSGGMQKQMHVLSHGFLTGAQICPTYSLPAVPIAKEDFGHLKWHNGSGTHVSATLTSSAN